MEVWCRRQRLRARGCAARAAGIAAAARAAVLPRAARARHSAHDAGHPRWRRRRCARGTSPRARRARHRSHGEDDRGRARDAVVRAGGARGARGAHRHERRMRQPGDLGRLPPRRAVAIAKVSASRRRCCSTPASRSSANATSERSRCCARASIPTTSHRSTPAITTITHGRSSTCRSPIRAHDEPPQFSDGTMGDRNRRSTRPEPPNLALLVP
jgi:hypothetical protein